MNTSDVQNALTEGQAATDVAQAFMQARATVPVTRLCEDLMDLMKALDDTMGPWTLEPPGQLSTLRIQPAVLSALSIAWKGHRPADKGWRSELRAVVLILNGRYRVVASDQLLDEVGPDLAKLITGRTERVIKTKGLKGKKAASADVTEDAA